MRENETATEQLVDRAQAGSLPAYNELFTRVARRLQFYIRARMGTKLKDKVEASDVLQDVYLEAHRSFASFTTRGEGDFSRWLYRIVDNRLNNLAKHFNAKKRSLPPGMVDIPGLLEQGVHLDQTGPSTAFDRKEKLGALSENLEGLSSIEREVVLLRFFHELTLEAIAEKLDTSRPRVTRILGAAVVKLGSALRDSDLGRLEP